MSSFVIGKKEYIKAAGFVAGIMAEKNHYREPVIYLWDYKEGQLFTDERIQQRFAQLYRDNATSVQLQYSDATCEKDDDRYEAEFQAMKKATHKIYTQALCGDPAALKQAIQNFHMFSRSVAYQIEDEKLNHRSAAFLNRINSALLGMLMDLDHIGSDSWATFDLEKKAE